MKLFFKLTLFIIFFGILMPVLFGLLLREEADGKTLKLYIKAEDRCIIINETDYLIGVTAAEMPASFHDEALKAQAVAARSYYIRKSKKYKENNPHKGDADVCTDFNHCQAYKDKEALKKQWGDDFNKNYKKIEDAVNITKGQVLKHNGEVIDAVFHSTSSGRTQNAEDVWQESVDYLKSVESDIDKKSPRYLSVKSFTEEELKDLLEIESEKIEIGDIIYNEGLTVKSIDICGKIFSGTDIRSKLKLNSACFSITRETGDIIFNVKGYGHGVGMSQWGANLLAQEGKTYDKILKKYYTGVEIEDM